MVNAPSMPLIMAILCGIIVMQQFYFLWQIQKLVDKLMSRSYTEYSQATKPKKELSIKLPEDLPEDLRVLQEFQM